jgi:hypothetical protein
MVRVEGSKEKTSVLATWALTPVAGAPDVQVGMSMSGSVSNPARGVGVWALAGEAKPRANDSRRKHDNHP